MANLGELKAILDADPTRLNKNLKDSERRFKSYEKRTTESLGRVKGAFRGVAASITRVTSRLGTLGTAFGLAGLGGAIVLPIRSFASFEEGLAKIATLTPKVDRVFGDLANTMRRLSRDFGISRKELTEAGFDMISSGIDIAKANELLYASSVLATGGFASMSTANNALITVLQIYKDQVKDATDAADFLFKVQEGGRTTVEGVASVFGQFASIAKTLDVDLNTLGAAFSAMTQSAVGNEIVATRLRAIFNAFSSKSAPAAEKAAAKYGVALNTSAVQGKELVRTIEKLTDATAEELALMFPNIRARAGIADLITFQSKLQSELINITNREGAAMRGANKALETTASSLKRLKEAAVALSEKLGGIFVPLVEGANAAIQPLADLTEAMDNLSTGTSPNLRAELERLTGQIAKSSSVWERLVLGFKAAGKTMLSPIEALQLTWRDYMSIVTSSEEPIRLLSDEMKIWGNTVEEAAENQKKFNEMQAAISEADIEAKTRAWFGRVEALKALTRGQKEATEIIERHNKLIREQTEIPLQGPTIQRARFLPSLTSPKPLFLIEDLKRESKALKEFQDLFEKITLSNKELAIKSFQERMEGFKTLIAQKKISFAEWQLLWNEGMLKINKQFKTSTVEMGKFAQRAAENIEDAFEEFFFKAFTGQLNDMRSFFASSVNSMLRIWSSFIAQMAARQIFTVNSAGALQAGPLLSRAIGFFGGLFGGGGAIPSPSSFAFRPSGPMTVPIFQQGGIVRQPTFGLLGEAGPELVMPLHKLDSLRGSGAAMVSQTFNISPGVPEAVRREMILMLPQIKRVAIEAVREERAKGGPFATDFGAGRSRGK